MATNGTGKKPTLAAKAVTDAFDMSDSKNLLKYVWTGALLPTDVDAYKKRVNVIGDLEDKLKPLVQSVVSEYAIVNTHCKQFKDIDYPQVVSLASDMYAYAQRAGGKDSTSYYAKILQYGQAVYDDLQADPVDQTKLAKDQAVVNALINKELASITALQTKSANVKQMLHDFDSTCRTDQKNLNDVHKPITDLLTGDGGEITRLQGEIDAKKKELSADRDEYEKDIIIASTAASYIWFFPFGTIAGAVTMGVYSDKAVKMKKTIDALNDLINQDNAELKTDLNIQNQGNLIDGDLASISDLIAKAIPAIEAMEGAWGAIADDLTTILNAVKTTDVTEDPILQEIDAGQIVQDWNDLAKEINTYRTTAYITPTETDISAAKAQFDTMVNNMPPPS